GARTYHGTATTRPYPLSLHDALPIFLRGIGLIVPGAGIQHRHHGISGTLEQTCRRVEGGLGQLVDKAVELGSGHTPNRTIGEVLDRKSTRLNSSHLGISYAVFCL